MQHTPSDNPAASVCTRVLRQASFSHAERMVIAISRHDPVSGLTRSSRTKRLLKQIIGIRERAPFADRRLEALRRMAVALRAKREDHAIFEADEFYAAGFRSEDLTYLAAIIDAANRSVRREQQQ